MAEEYSFDLSLTTNVRFLDEERFYELKDITRELMMVVSGASPGVATRTRRASSWTPILSGANPAARLATIDRKG